MNGRGWKWRRDVARSAASFLARVDDDTPEECARWTPLLTALFDGEASEAQAREARRHLLSCERCAQTWLGWNQTRALLLDQMAPALPQNLLWRIRVACGLASPPQTSDLHAQILARTSRAAHKQPAPRARLSFPRWSPWQWSTTALAALVLLLVRNSFAPIAPTAPAFDAAPAFEPAPERQARSSRDEVSLPILASDPALSKPKSTATASVVASKTRESVASGAARTLLLAQRERQSLRSARAASSAPLPVLASLPEPAWAPVPVLASLRVEAEPLLSPESRRLRSSVRTRHLGARKMSSHSRTSHPVASRPIVLAPAFVAAPVERDLTQAPAITSSFRSGRRSHVLLASTLHERAPLRISTPRVRPVTFSSDAGADDSGLDDLDSTVEEYRSALASDTSD